MTDCEHVLSPFLQKTIDGILHARCIHCKEWVEAVEFFKKMGLIE